MNATSIPARTARHGAVFARVVQSGHPEVRMHVLYSNRDGEAPQPYGPLIQFFLEMDAGRRLSWQREMVRAVGLLLDHVSRHEGTEVEHVPADTLRAFAESLLMGTLHQRVDERKGLLWPPRSRTCAGRYLNLVTAFTDWLATRSHTSRANVWRDATPTERLIALRHLKHRANRSLLSHAAYRQHDAVSAGRVRVVQISRAPKSGSFGEVRFFDATIFQRLLLQGFARPAPRGAPLARRLRLRDVLIALLLHGGGLRVSEAFHVYAGDVKVDPQQRDSALVRLYHPEHGAAPVEDGRRWRDREHYLRERWNLQPRTLEEGRFHAGWKNLALSDQRQGFAVVHWFPAYWGSVFLMFFRAYLASRPKGAHPFLFVSEHKAHRGEPYTIAAFEQAHAGALRRIGLVPAKQRGTTAHAHRHAYGRALKDANLDPLFIQRAMHHRSPGSQAVYTAPSASEVSAALREATPRLRNGDVLPEPFEGLLHDET